MWCVKWLWKKGCLWGLLASVAVVCSEVLAGVELQQQQQPLHSVDLENVLLFDVTVSVVSWTGQDGDEFVDRDVDLQIFSQLDPVQQTQEFCEHHQLPTSMCAPLIQLVKQKVSRAMILQQNNEQFISGVVSHTKQEDVTSLNSNSESKSKSSIYIMQDRDDKHEHEPTTTRSSDGISHNSSETIPSPSPPPKQYSSFSCISGNQEFKEDWKSGNRGNISFVDHRVCMLENICIDYPSVNYYQHPEEARAPAFLQLMKSEEIARLNTNDAPGGVRVIESTVPGPGMDDHTWFLSQAYVGYNMAHLLKVCAM